MQQQQKKVWGKELRESVGLISFHFSLLLSFSIDEFSFIELWRKWKESKINYGIVGILNKINNINKHTHTHNATNNFFLSRFNTYFMEWKFAKQKKWNTFLMKLYKKNKTKFNSWNIWNKLNWSEHNKIIRHQYISIFHNKNWRKILILFRYFSFLIPLPILFGLKFFLKQPAFTTNDSIMKLAINFEF